MRSTQTLNSSFLPCISRLLRSGLILTGLMGPLCAFAGDADRVVPTRAEFHAAQDPGVDAAVDAIVRELAAVGAGPGETRASNPAQGIAPGIGKSMQTVPETSRGSRLSPRGAANAAEALADEAAAVRALQGGDEGEDDHAM